MSCDFANGFSFDLVVAGAIYGCLRLLVLRELIKALGTIDVAF